MKSAVLVLLLVVYARHPAQAEILSHSSANLNKVYSVLLYCTYIKGTWKGNKFFVLFCLNRFGTGPLHLLLMRGVVDSAYHRGDSSTLRITDPIQGVGNSPHHQSGSIKSSPLFLYVNPLVTKRLICARQVVIEQRRLASCIISCIGSGTSRKGCRTNQIR
jgi:hypothetical protein